MKRELVGSIWIDTASVIVGDPCQLLCDERYKDEPPLWYGDYCEMKRLPTTLEPDDGRTPMDATVIKDTAAISVPTVENCDGWCDVYVERDKDGWARRLIVDLNAKVNPGKGS